MPIQLVAYGYVDPKGPVPDCSLHSISPEVEAYLEAHLAKLLEKALRGSAPTAVFSDMASRGHFESLRSGSQNAFLDTARLLAQKLHEQMDGRSKRGFFVAIRKKASSDNMQSSILKLDVHDEMAAAARRNSDGQLTLEAVQDLLDIPGELQKGAVYPDSRDGSDVVVGEKVARDTAIYFLESLGVQQFASDAAAGRVFMLAVYSTSPSKAPRVATTLNQEPHPLSPEQFFSKHPEVLSPEERDKVMADLRERRHPVQKLPAREKVLKEIISADGIEVKGRADDLAEKVDIEEDVEGWRIIVRVQSEPRRRYDSR